MYLRKDIQMVAFLIQKGIEFKAWVHTVEVDELKIDADTVFKLREYETTSEVSHIRKIKTNRQIKREKAKRQKLTLRAVLSHVGLEVISFEKYKKKIKNKKVVIEKKAKKTPKIKKTPINFKRIAIIAEKIDQQPKPIVRPKAEYSNQQWTDYYND